LSEGTAVEGLEIPEMAAHEHPDLAGMLSGSRVDA
jgi:hypothetical protein